MRTSSIVQAILAATAIAASVSVARPATACTPSSTNVCSHANATVLTNPSVYIVYWGWSCTPPASGMWCGNSSSCANTCNASTCPSDTIDERHVLEAVFTDSSWGGYSGIGGTRWVNTAAQYDGLNFSSGRPGNIGNNAGLIPASGPSHIWYDSSHPYIDDNCATGTPAVQDEVRAATSHFIATGALSSASADAIIVIARPPGSQGATGGVMAYHSSLGDSATQTVYADMNYNESAVTVGSNGVPAAGGGQYIMEHEFMEALTDPRPTHIPAWNDPTEVGDMCEDIPSALAGGVIVALQPSSVPQWRATLTPYTSDAAGTGGACVYARATHGNLFGVGTNLRLYEKRLEFNVNGSAIVQDAFQDWGTLGASGALNGGPAAVSWAPGRIDVFNFDSSYTLRHAFSDAKIPACSGVSTPCFDSWGGPPAGVSFRGAEPAVASWGPQRLDVFAASSASGLFHWIWDAGGSSGWVAAGAPGVALRDGGVSAVSYTPGTVDVFAVGVDNNIYRWTWHGTGTTGSGSWSLWLGGQTYDGTAMVWQGKPAVASWLPGRFDVMLTDSQGRLFDCGADNGVPWGNCAHWTPPSGVTFTNSPTITALGDQRLLVSARGSDGQAWMKLWDFGQNTGPWVATGGAFAGASVAASSW